MAGGSRNPAVALATLCLLAAACRESTSGPRIELIDPSATDHHTIDAVEAGNSMSIQLAGLPPKAPVEVFLNDDAGREWSYARLRSDSAGRIGPTVFWYQSGVIGKTSRRINFRPDPSFVTFEEAEAYFAKHALTLTVRDRNRKELIRHKVPFTPRKTPQLFPSNAEGVLYNSVNVRNEDLYVSGRHFPAGSTVHLFVVDNQYQWHVGDSLIDRTGAEGQPGVETIRLKPNQTSFTVKAWDHLRARPGAFDLVARIGAELGRRVLDRNDILAFDDETAVLYYIIINGNVVIETAGRMKDAPAKFEFSDAFEKLQDVYGAVDPTDVPAVHSGGNYAAYWVVEDQPPAYWDGAAPALVDVSGGPEIQRVKYWCINMSRRLIWPSATQADPVKGYDVVVDFGSTAAMNAADFTPDNTYNKGTDFIDGYDQPGFTVFEDPGSVGPYPVGQVELNEPNGISGITDPTGVTGPTQSVTLAWARIMYPATVAGTGTPVNAAKANYPVALFLHGRHFNCDNDGSGPGLSGSYSFSCAVANRIPSHEGYNYIMERLASQGIFSISISAHDIQPGLGVWDYDARGRLILKFLDKLRSWTTSGTDPFGGIFNGKIDVSKVALSGHSRGGEGVVAAQVLNATWPTPHSIVAVNAIAPTDQNGSHYVLTTGAYFLLIAARDGDVSNMQGFRTYDRLYPQGAALRLPKMVSWVYRANHNYFNTIWTGTAALGSPNPWAGSRDDASGLTPAMSAADQRSVGLTTVAAFLRWQLQGIDPYREIFTGRVDPAGMPNELVYWTYQDGDRKAVDDFEQNPLNPAVNSLGGAATTTGFTTGAEQLFNNSSSTYPGGLPTDASFYHDTRGLKLAWATSQTYTTVLPPGQRDVSMFSHLTLRVAKKVTGAQVAGPAINLLINVEDGSGNKALWDLRTDQFDPVPHPFEGSQIPNQALMNGVRIPLRNFTQNNSGVDLTDIAMITIRTEGSGQIGLDDIEFGK